MNAWKCPCEIIDFTSEGKINKTLYLYNNNE